MKACTRRARALTVRPPRPDCPLLAPVVAVDQRGYNDSDKPDGIASFRLQLLASDIKVGGGAVLHRYACTAH